MLSKPRSPTARQQTALVSIRMEYKKRAELVGKRFACLARQRGPEAADTVADGDPRADAKDTADIAAWKWRCGIIRAATHRSETAPDLKLSWSDENAPFIKKVSSNLSSCFKIFALYSSEANLYATLLRKICR
ncbi:hypothetical protein ONE63_003119 [Megalurothrips usitatus]|uniref:DUF7030 domain-containing protein n=1 Tax=Megalurothrips usitatus TaxID=439358 RepID=A0AAV7XCW5_9NEOP|nr:hypothetical protein ONE63_003119 [Megalurothrips usitatus]